jgi:hypothetical protein
MAADDFWTLHMGKRKERPRKEEQQSATKAAGGYIQKQKRNQN